MYQTALYLNDVNSYLATIHREIPLKATLHFLRNLKTSSIQLREAYILSRNVAAFNGRNEVVTKNVFIPLSPASWNDPKGRRRRDITHLGGDISRETSEDRLLIGLATGTVDSSNMTNYRCPGSVPSSLPLHAFPPVISHASTRP